MNSFERGLFALLLRLHPHQERDTYSAEFREVLEERILRRKAARRSIWSLWVREASAILVQRYRGRSYQFNPGRRKNAMLASVIQDLRGGVRGIRRSPGISLVVVSTLAIAIGASSSIFSVVNGVLLKPLTVPDQDRILAVWGRFLPESGFNFEYFSLSAPEYFDYLEQNTTLDGAAAYYNTGVTVTGGG